MISSEIELAIKIGELIYGSESHESAALRATIAKLGDVKLDIKPTFDIHLSHHLRALTEHRGDVSYERFITDCLTAIEEGGAFTKWYTMERLACFCRAIGYIYPPSSMMWGDVWNNAFCIPGIKNHKEFYDYADNLIRQANEIKKESLTKRKENV